MASKTAALDLETVVGALLQGFQQTEPGTWRTSAEITTERRTNADLRNRWFWAANFAMYKVEKRGAVLYFGGRESNIIFNNIEEATSQLIKTGNYVPEKEGIDAVVASVESGSTLRVKLSELKLKRLNDEFSYFDIDTSRYGKLNAAQRSLAERVYGSGKDFEENMGMLAKATIGKTRIYVLKPAYVKSKVVGDGAVARACWLGKFTDNSIFDADGRGADNTSYALRAVRRKVVAEGGAPKPLQGKPDDFKSVYDTLVGKIRASLLAVLRKCVLK